jgi:hypothetical protein
MKPGKQHIAILSLILLLTGCATLPSKISLLTYGLGRTQKPLVIDSGGKKLEFGVILGGGFTFVITHKKTKINSVILLDDENEILWHVEKQDKESATFGVIIYGEQNKQYTQSYPEKVEDCVPLELDETYHIEIDYDGTVIKRKFIFNRSEIIITKDEIEGG